MDYDQKQVDEEFNALIEETRKAGLADTADHFAKAQGMERINAVRFLNAMFTEHEKQKRIKSALIAVVWIATLVVLAFAEGWVYVR
jgi:uncharacterized BrkB/YihY/UPF0761 family membrane protein